MTWSQDLHVNSMTSLMSMLLKEVISIMFVMLILKNHVMSYKKLSTTSLVPNFYGIHHQDDFQYWSLNWAGMGFTNHVCKGYQILITGLSRHSPSKMLPENAYITGEIIHRHYRAASFYIVIPGLECYTFWKIQRVLICMYKTGTNGF